MIMNAIIIGISIIIMEDKIIILLI